MQVIRMSRDNPSRTVSEKLAEMIRALRLETRYSKSEILAFYASNAPMGGNVVGLDAASWRYFGRAPEDLTWAESATLAVLPNAPSLIFPGRNQERLREKRDRVLEYLLKENIIDEQTYSLSIQERLPGKPAPLPQIGQFAMQHLERQGKNGQRIESTLDASLQIRATELANKYATKYAMNGVHNAAVVVIEVETKEVIAYVGNTLSAGLDHNCMVDVALAPRSTGSILKPFLYAASLDEGNILPHSLLPDIPAYFSGYSPKNFHRQYDGVVPASEALSRSLNVPSVMMLSDFGVAKFKYSLSDLGMTTFNRSADTYGLSLILGGGEATLFELTSAYAGMSRQLLQFTTHNGLYGSANFAPARMTNASEVENFSSTAPLSSASIYLTYEALLEVNRPETEAGWDEYSSSRKIAWKTGTSWGGRDAWAIGTTSNFVVGVWIGNADGEGRPGMTGAGAAAPLMFEMFDALPAEAWFNPPYDDMIEVAVCNQSGCLPSPHCHNRKKEWRPVGHQLSTPCKFHKSIHVHSETGLQVNHSCVDADELETKSWFILPPVQEWYFKQNHPEYMAVPEVEPSCSMLVEESPLDMIYPRHSGSVYVPVDLDGQLSRVVLEATHRNPLTKLFWHLDNVYLGETRSIHKMEILPDAGQHVLTIVDEEGHSITRKITVEISRQGSNIASN